MMSMKASWCSLCMVADGVHTVNMGGGLWFRRIDPFSFELVND